MGTYLNPGKASYEEAVNSEIFIDKTEMIQYLNSLVNPKKKYVSVSRPRRFGKTMAADMICAYYDREADSHELFSKRKLSETSPVKKGDNEIAWDGYIGKFDVIRLVMTQFFKTDITVDEALKKFQKLVVRDLKKSYPDVDYFDDCDLIQSMEDVCSETHTQFVIVIDEWDAVFRACKEDEAGQTKYLDFLRDLLKDKPYVALAYMTGILPIKKCKTHSSLNMFREHSMTDAMQMAPYTGFSTEEVLKLAKKYDRNFDSIKEWYGGYEVSNIVPRGITKEYGKGNYSDYKTTIYNPLSVVKAMTTGVIKNYWNKTETYEVLADYIHMDYDGLKDAVALLMDGGKLVIDTSTYQNDMTTFNGRDDVLSLLVHLGYLGFDDETSEVFIPNKEILDEFRSSTKPGE